jgi:hypothetical protein
LTLEGATELDITALQLLYAAERDAAKAGSRLESWVSWLRGLDLNQRPLGYERPRARVNN